MMKMSANNMNEPIVRWRERGVAFFYVIISLFPMLSFHFFYVRYCTLKRVYKES